MIRFHVVLTACSFPRSGFVTSGLRTAGAAFGVAAYGVVAFPPAQARAAVCCYFLSVVREAMHGRALCCC